MKKGRIRNKAFDRGVLMMGRRHTLKDQGGSVLVIALVILILLTIIGISATTTSEIEIRTAGNEAILKRNLYLAESAAMAGAQTLENETDPTLLRSASLDWLHFTLPDVDIHSDTNWEPSNNNSSQALDASNRYLAVYKGIAPGGSLDIGGRPTSLHEYAIFGRSAKIAGEAIVEIGYRKRF